MFSPLRKLSVLFCLLFLTAPLYAQVAYTNLNLSPNPQKNIQPETQLQLPPPKIEPSVLVQAEKTHNAFLNFLNSQAYAAEEKREKDEKKILREKWKKALGMDIFSPYFKAKEIEDRISEKFSMRIHKIKGKPKLEDNQLKYIFTVKF